jgi:hypothetical protein
MGLLESYYVKAGDQPRFIETVMRCVTSFSFAVMFNVGKLEEFKPSRGIRQGDPISSYLFLQAAEGLSCFLKSYSPEDVIPGIKVAPNAPQVNHLLFADDSLLFL